jgi:hypothetical protein
MAEHHATLAKCYGKLAGMSKAGKSDMKDGEDGLASTLEKIAECHKSASEFHKTAMQECKKSAGSEFSKAADADLAKRIAHLEGQLVPTNVSAVVPDANIRAVPRTGMRMPPQRPDVPLQFQHLVKVEED